MLYGPWSRLGVFPHCRFIDELGGEIESMSEVQLDCQNQPQQALHTIVEMVNALRTDKPLLVLGSRSLVQLSRGTCLNKFFRRGKIFIFNLHWKVCWVLGFSWAMMQTWVRWQNAGGVLAKTLTTLSLSKLTGVGAGLFQNGNIMRDIGYAGELGHVPISTEGLCRCGMTGCLEAHIGLPHLNERVRTHIEGTQYTLLSWL